MGYLSLFVVVAVVLVGSANSFVLSSLHALGVQFSKHPPTWPNGVLARNHGQPPPTSSPSRPADGRRCPIGSALSSRAPGRLWAPPRPEWRNLELGPNRRAWRSRAPLLSPRRPRGVDSATQTSPPPPPPPVSLRSARPTGVLASARPSYGRPQAERSAVRVAKSWRSSLARP